MPLRWGFGYQIFHATNANAADRCGLGLSFGLSGLLSGCGVKGGPLLLQTNRKVGERAHLLTCDGRYRFVIPVDENDDDKEDSDD